MRGQPWTEERIALLRSLWSQSRTAAEIAALLGGLSRSAVMGKVFRLRLPAAAATGAPSVAQDAASIIPDDAPARRRRRGGGRKRRPKPPPATPRQHKSLLELTNNTCRWPHGRPGSERFFFCGAPEADLERSIPYCARHMRRAYGGVAVVAESPPTAPFGPRLPRLVG